MPYNMPYSLGPSLSPITVIGLDCDDPGSLEKTLRRDGSLLQAADIICGSSLVLKTLARDPKLAGKLLPLTPPLEPLFECLAGLRAEGMRVVALAEGDPLFYGIGASLARRLGPEAISIKPAINAMQAACARLSLPWHNVFAMSLHGRAGLLPLYGAISRNQAICALVSPICGPDLLARMLLDRGVDWYHVHIFENMGNASEIHKEMSLEECARSAFAPASTVILLPMGANRTQPLGIDSAALTGQATLKKPVRGAILELLRISPHDLFWHIGAGAGVLAIEACGLAYAGSVMAVEKNWVKALDIQRNRQLCGAVNLSVCLGHAPQCLENLPKPDCIFIGGGLTPQNGPELLEYCSKKLKPGGHIVANCTMLDSFTLGRRFMEYLRWPLEIQQIQAASATAYTSQEHFQPLNPVFLLAAQKPANEKVIDLA